MLLILLLLLLLGIKIIRPIGSSSTDMVLRQFSRKGNKDLDVNNYLTKPPVSKAVVPLTHFAASHLCKSSLTPRRESL